MRGGNSQQALAANKKRASDLDACKLAKGNPPKPLVPAPPPAPPANAAALCAIYASQAVADAQKAAALNCGLFGPRWNADYGAHFGWCVAVSNPAMMMIESSARQTALDACSGN